MAYDVLTIGRISVDVYPNEIGVDLEDVRSFGKYLGGSPSNVALAAARHGRRSAVIARTGNDPFGNYLHRELRKFGVDDSFVTPEELDLEAVRETRIFGSTVTGLCQEPSRSAHIRRTRPGPAEPEDSGPILIHVETDPLLDAPDSESWWDVPVAQTSELDSTRNAFKTYAQQKKRQRPYL